MTQKTTQASSQKTTQASLPKTKKRSGARLIVPDGSKLSGVEFTDTTRQKVKTDEQKSGKKTMGFWGSNNIPKVIKGWMKFIREKLSQIAKSQKTKNQENVMAKFNEIAEKSNSIPPNKQTPPPSIKSK